MVTHKIFATDGLFDKPQKLVLNSYVVEASKVSLAVRVDLLTCLYVGMVLLSLEAVPQTQTQFALYLYNKQTVWEITQYSFKCP